MKLTTVEPARPRGRILQTSRIESVGTHASPARERVLATLPFHAIGDRAPSIGTIEKEGKP